MVCFSTRVTRYFHEKEFNIWVSIGIPFFMFGQAMNPIIRSDGSPRLAMITTVAGQVTTAAISLGYLFNMKQVKLCRDSFSLRPRLAGKFLPLGFTSF